MKNDMTTVHTDLLLLLERLSYMKTNTDDLQLREYSRILHDLIQDSAPQSRVHVVLTQIFQERPEISLENLIFCLFISCQYVAELAFDRFTSLASDNDKKKLLLSTFTEFGDTIADLCIRKNTSTNIVERYGGIEIILNIISRYRTGDLSFIDLGTGVGLGLLALKNDPSVMFRGNAIDVEENLLSLVGKMPQLRSMIGIDIEERDPKWVLACFLPGYKASRKKFSHLLNLIGSAKDITFFKGDYLKPESIMGLPKQQADVVTALNTLYVTGDYLNRDDATHRVLSALSPDSQRLSPFDYYLRPGGMFIEADSIDWSGATPPEKNFYSYQAWVKQDGRFRKFEVLIGKSKNKHTPHDLVEILEEGKDFKEFLEYLKETHT